MASALIVVAVIAVLVHHSRTQSRGGPVVTTPATISAGRGTATQCPAGAYDGHCIVVPGGKKTTTSTTTAGSTTTGS
jgi:hypothetical protein